MFYIGVDLPTNFLRFVVLVRAVQRALKFIGFLRLILSGSVLDANDNLVLESTGNSVWFRVPVCRQYRGGESTR